MQKGALTLLAGGFILTAVAAGASPGAFGNVDSPKPNATVYGLVTVKGWVLDVNAVDNIKIYVDRTYDQAVANPCSSPPAIDCNTADINLPRVDVLNVFPTYVNSATPNPGFITSFYAPGLPNLHGDGTHTLLVLVTESADPTHPISLTENPIPFTIDNTINQPPFGWIDIPSPVGVEGVNSAFPITGWALDALGIDHVDFLVDGQIMAGAVCCNVPSSSDCNDSPTIPFCSASSSIFGTSRPDVQAAYPQVPELLSLFSGFQANIDSTSLIDGVHVITVRATNVVGQSTVVGSRTVQVDNAALNLHPFGTIDAPLDQLTFYPFCASGGLPSPIPPAVEPQLDTVSGWVLDTGARLDFGQTGYVELLIDNVVVANTRADCIQNANAGGAFENCYGVNRHDVEQAYPGFVNSDNAGYVFDFFAVPNQTGQLSIQVPIQLSTDPFSYDAEERTEVVPGKHTISVQAGDDAGTITQIAAMSADFETCAGDFPAFGYIDDPLNYQFISGRSDVVGWAYDIDRIRQIDFDVDGVVVGSASTPCAPSGYGYGCERIDVPINDARVPTPFVGFRYSLDTTRLSDSPHDLNVYVVDVDGDRDLIGRRKFVVNNNVPTHGN